MSANHLPGEDLALYVLGTLEPAATARLEAHVAVCESCAAALGAEAQLEVKLQAVVPAALRLLPTVPSVVPPLPLLTDAPAPRRRWFAGAMLVAPLIVIVGLALSRVTPPPPMSPREPSLAALSVLSAADSEWSSEAGPLQCELTGSGLLCDAQLSAPPAVLCEAAFSAAASWLPLASSEGFTPITAACYAPR